MTVLRSPGWRQPSDQTAPQGHVAEEVWERCPCGSPPVDKFDAAARHRHIGPDPECSECQGTGWWATKRIIRPIPKPDFSEQAALAQLKSKDTILLRAAKTLDYNADILLAAGKRTEAGQTKQAAQAIREGVGEED